MSVLAALLLASHAAAVRVGVSCNGEVILANTTSGLNVTVDSVLYSKVDCDLALSLAERMPELCVMFDSLTASTGVDGGWEVQNAYFASMLNNLRSRDTTLDIFRMKGMEGLEEHLLPMGEATVNISDKYLLRNKAKEVVAYSDTATQYVLFYNDNMFARHNLSTPTEGWDEFEATMLLLQERERVYRQKCCDENDGWCSCGKPEDFYALAIEHFEHVTQQDRWLRSSYLTDFFATLLSGNSGGTIMDSDGEVTVDNPQAVKTLEMWKRWYKTIVHPKTTQPSYLVYYDDVGVAMDLNFYISSVGKSSSRPISLGPIPGPSGTGGTDFRAVGVSKYVRHPEAALEVMKLITPSQIDVQVVTSHPPVDKRVVNGTPRYDDWCEHSYKHIVCESTERYPDFWQRPYVPIGHHCGESRLRCTGVVYNYVVSSLQDDLEPEAALEQMTADLVGLLAEPSAPSSGGMWTVEFTFLVMASIVGGIAFGTLMFVAWGMVRPLRGSGKLAFPFSVMLSVCIAVILGVVIGVATDYSSNTSRSISKDLALKLRTETLAGVQTAVLTQLESAAGSSDERKGKLARMQAGLAVTVGFLKLERGALVAVVNKEDGSVIGSSDEWMQRVGANLRGTKTPVEDVFMSEDEGSVPDSVPLSPWLAEVPSAVPNWHNVTSKEIAESYSASVGGETVHFSMLATGHRGIELLVLYFVPEEVILGKANDDVDKLVYMSGGLAVLAVVAVAGVAVVSTLPLVTLSRDMEAVRVMRMEEVRSGKGSRLAEMNALLLGFHSMVEMLAEYKSYMPKTLFIEKGEDSDEVATTVGSAGRRSETRSTASSGGSRASLSSATLESIGHGPQLDKLAVSEGCVVRVRVVGLHEVLEKAGRAAGLFMDLLSTAEQVSETYRACLHTFSAVEPGDFVLSWGVVNGGIPHRERAARAALHLAEAGRFVLGVTYVNGQCKSGNMGTSKTRGFGIVGRVMEECGRVSRTSVEMAGALGRSVVLCNEGVQRKLSGEMHVELVDLLGGLRSALRRVYRIVKMRDIDCQEWMYELEEQQRAVKHPVTMCLEEVAKGGDLGAAATVLADTARGADEFGLNTMIATRLEGVKGIRVDVMTVPSLFAATFFVPHVKKQTNGAGSQ